MRTIVRLAIRLKGMGKVRCLLHMLAFSMHVLANGFLLLFAPCTLHDMMLAHAARSLDDYKKGTQIHANKGICPENGTINFE